MTKKTSREIALAWIEANKNNKGVDVVGKKEWIGITELIDLIETFGAQEKSLFDLYHHIIWELDKTNKKTNGDK